MAPWSCCYYRVEVFTHTYLSIVRITIFRCLFVLCWAKLSFFSFKKIVMYIIYKNMIIFFLLEVNIAELNWLDWIDEAVLSWHDFHIFHTLDQFRSLLADSEKIEEVNNIFLRMIRIFITNTGCPIWNPNFFVKPISRNFSWKYKWFHEKFAGFIWITLSMLRIISK